METIYARVLTVSGDDGECGVGYEVVVLDAAGEVLDEYTGSNNPWNSAHGLPCDHPAAYSIEKLEDAAQVTAREMAHEYGAEWDGRVERINVGYLLQRVE